MKKKINKSDDQYNSHTNWDPDKRIDELKNDGSRGGEGEEEKRGKVAKGNLDAINTVCMTHENIFRSSQLRLTKKST